MDKKIIRSESLLHLNGLSSSRLADINIGITNELLRFFSIRPDLIDKVGGAYLPMKNEIAADFPLLTSKLSLSLGYPIKTDTGMDFALSNNPVGNIWLAAPYKVVRPEWLFIPGLAFGLKGERLGRGGGFYDTYLKSHIPIRIALTSSALICDNIPIESHDELMDFIITENFCWDVTHQKKI